MQKNKTIVIAAGGTGGHIFPAQSLTELLLKDGYEVCLVCDDRAEQFLQGAFKKIEKFYIVSEKHTSSRLRKFFYYSKLLLSIFKVKKFLKQKNPVLVIGFGGYPSFPTLAAAISLKVKIAIHEQNAVLGVVNRYFAPFATRIFVSFLPTQKLKDKYLTKAVLAGSLVRGSIKKLKKKKDKFLRIVVIGGSQGAQVMTDFVPDALKLLPMDIQKKIIVHQQARGNLVEETESKYNSFPGKVEISEFFEDVGKLLNEADLVICRAGASTIAEITMLGKAAIFIPYPHAVDNHQYYNALHLVDHGAASMINQNELTPTLLASKISKILSQDGYKTDLEHNAESLWDNDLPTKFLNEIKGIISN